MKKRDGRELLKRGVEIMTEYQTRLAAQDTYGVLVVLQALDAAGKDGTIRHVMSGVNPQGVSVHSFKVPSPEEINHDYLWRYARCLPGRGEIGIFNRSHYEEVLVVRVHPENLKRQRLPGGARQRRVEAALPRHQRLGAPLKRQRLQDRQAPAEPLAGGAARAFLAAHRPARPQLEVLRRRRPRTHLLERLSEGVLRDADGHEQRVGALVCDPRRPQVVRAHLRLGVSPTP